MVTINSLTGSGLKDWLIQQCTAIILGAYVIFLFGFILAHPGLDFKTWHHLFSNPIMRIFSFMALLSLVLHVWVGILTVIGDYIPSSLLKLFLTLFMIFSLLSYLVYGVMILWA